MLLIVGTGHVFKLEDSVRFIIKNSWPDAVLVELDEKRYRVLDGTYDYPKDAEPKKIPRAIRNLGKSQSRTAVRYGTYVGFELLEAVRAGKASGAEVILMDGDAVETLVRMWNEMSLAEKIRWRFSSFFGSIRPKKNMEKTQTDFSENEKEYMERMRKRFPTMMRILHDERNRVMADAITEAYGRHKKIIAVVGDAHVEGICALLPEDTKVKKIRLADIRDEKKMGKIMSDIWYDRVE